MKKLLYFGAVFTLLLATACGVPKLKNGEEVVAKIDGKEYTADDLYKELKGQYGYNTVMSWVDRQIAEKEVETTDEINSYVDEAITFYQQYADSYGMSLPDFAANYLGAAGVTSEQDVRDYIMNDRKLSIAIQKKVEKDLKDSDVQKYYDENYKTTYTYKDILVTTKDTSKAVDKIKKELKDKKKDDLIKAFDKMAKSDYSSNESDENEVKDATKNKVDEAIWKKLKDLDDYKYAEVKAADGTHIILKISKGKGKALEDVEDEIKENLAVSKLQSNQFLSYDILTELRNKYKIAFYDDDIKKNYDDFLDQLDKAKKDAEKSNKTSNK